MEFHFALYNYDWADKSDKIKNGIAIMMSVAARPLQIAVGGAYYLSLITYRIVSRATSIVEPVNAPVFKIILYKNHIVFGHY